MGRLFAEKQFSQWQCQAVGYPFIEPASPLTDQQPSPAGRSAELQLGAVTEKQRGLARYKTIRTGTKSQTIASACWTAAAFATFQRCLVSWKASFRPCACLGTMNPPLTHPTRGTFAARTNARSLPGRGRGWVDSWRAALV